MSGAEILGQVVGGVMAALLVVACAIIAGALAVEAVLDVRAKLRAHRAKAADMYSTKEVVR